MNQVNRVLEHFRKLVYPFARQAKRGTSSRFDTSDIVQESILQIWQEMNKGQGLQFTANKTYLRKVGHGHACRQMREHSAQKRATWKEVSLPSNGAHPHAADDPHENVANGELVLLVLRQLEHLNDREKVVICRRFFDQRTLKEIAEELSVSIDVVRTCQNNAIAKLRRKLTQATQSEK